MIRPAGEGGRAAVLIALFAAVCVVWGLTWIPIKIGLAAIPPFLFAAARAIAAGAILLALHAWRVGRPAVAGGDWPRLVLVGVLTYAAPFGLVYWGMTRINSGVAAVANLSFIPIGLLAAATLAGEERMTGRKVAAALLGIAGLAILHASDLRDAAADLKTAGTAAVALAAVVYGFGSVAGRPLLRRYSPLVVSGWVQVVGFACLLPLSTLVEPGSPASLVRLVEPRVFLAWTFLVLFGSVLAFTAYLRLTHEWSPSRAGYYAFVSPIIAVIAGMAFLDETVTPAGLFGMALMLGGTLLALSRARVEPGPLRGEQAAAVAE